MLKLFLGIISVFSALSLSLAAYSTDSVDTGAPPSPEEQRKLLAEMKRYGDEYVSNLPNFICTQLTRQFQAGKNSKHWHKGDTLTLKLTFNEGHEHRSLSLVNNKRFKPGDRRARTPLVTEGEFGILLSRVLGGENDAAFQWGRWDELRGKRLAVFDYTVDKRHSTLRLSLSAGLGAVIPYHGSVWADPQNGAVWRITDGASEIPPELETEEISTVIDYAPAAIGASEYLLPQTATVTSVFHASKVRNEYEYADYQKFGAESTVTFGAAAEAPSNTGTHP